ncbi:Vacuolar protein sorting-associated protein [Wickerhamomyces ciferrii]|uniref:Vacuolar protein sorting-associated protein n=1 Tax=Wickerhamomyces ciferrii (strain ATCC 14091 / BCRC 22168 / CBS 111 / JCM 3599 / NBRC 0793 / NRRL Y-1031 F-60-10) TaxID=1206466 RepID=K0KEY6_WICCF|nr:Vacuolar protein sorting-associated protein [Wickerhamomyces ciferrii]CCH41516.1 Vacuolar protein sorting-associated protein [Wickerhamomyces ciferrii]
MLESLVAGLLNRVLVSIWSGDVKLKNLRLKKESLDKLELPVDVKFGHLGELTLQIPWSNLKGKPVKVTIEDVYLLASPIIQDEYNEEEVLKRELNLKLQRLNDLELINKANPTNSLSPEENAKNESFTESLVTKIVDNLQVQIKNIHLRYEDVDNVFTDNPYAIGVTLDELSAISTDSNWKHTFISVSQQLTHKLLTLKSLCCYWNTDAKSIYTENQNELFEKFKNSIIDQDNLSQYEEFTQFLLRPVSGSGHLTVNKLGTTETQPHLKTELFFEEFGVDLDSNQYRDALLTASKFHWFNKTHKFKKFRPNVPLKGNSKEWFKYAAKCVLNEIHEKNYAWSWEFLSKRRENRIAYIKLWKEKLLLCDIAQPLPKQSQNEELENLHKELTFEDIKFFRSLAKKELRKERIANAESAPSSSENEQAVDNTSQQQQQPASGGWFSSWWSKPADTNDSSNEDKLVLTDEQREELYNAIEFDENKALEEAVNIPRDRINFQLSANLKKGGFTIKNRQSKKNLAEVIFEGCSAQVYQRPDSFLTNFSLQELKVEDGTESTLYKHVVSVKPLNTELETNQNNDEPFFQVSFEKNPLDGSADSALLAKLKSMTIFYHVHFINEIIKFFTPPKDHLDTINAILNAAEATMEGITSQTRMGLEAIWEEHKTINAKLDLQAPLIILPLDANSWSSPCAVVDAGHISLVSDLADKDKTNNIKNLSQEEYEKIDITELNRLMYDKFNLHLQDTQVLIGSTIKSTVEQLHDPHNNSSTILDKLDMKMLLEMSILPKASNLAKIRATAKLPAFIAKMNDYQYKIMMQLVDKCIPNFDIGNEENDENELKPVHGPLSLNKPVDSKFDLDNITESESAKSQKSESAKNIEKQHQFEFNFNVDKVQLLLSKCTDGSTMASDPIVDLVAERFELDFYKMETGMHVDLTLSTFNIEDYIEDSGPKEFKKIISSNNFTEKDGIERSSEAFRLKYDRTQRIVTVNNQNIEVFDQDVDLNLSALKVIVTRKSLLTILNFILTTFTNPNPEETPADILRHNDASQIETSPQQIRVNVNLEGIVLALNDNGIKLATLQLSTAHFNVLVLPEKMKVYSKLGALTVHDEVNEGSSRDSIVRKILSFDENQLAEFTYETFDPNAEKDLDYASSFKFNVGSLRVNFVEGPVNKILDFLSKFQKMKSLYDSARDTAFNQVNIQDQNSMLFDITIKTPIIVFPKLVDYNKSLYDNVTLYLGEFSASNKFINISGDSINNISCGLRSTKITSLFHQNNVKQSFKILEDTDIIFDIKYNEKTNEKVQMLIDGNMSEVIADLTELQLSYLYSLSKSVPAAFTFDDSSLSEIEDAALNANKVIAPDATYGADSEIISKPDNNVLTAEFPENIKVDFKFDLPRVALTIHNSTNEAESLDKTAISTFSLEDIGVEFKQKYDTHFDSEVHVQSLVARDVREIKDNQFPEIIPKVASDKYHFSATATTNGPSNDKNTIVAVNINSPKLILALDYLFSLKNFTDVALSQPEHITHKEITNEDDEELPSNAAQTEYTQENEDDDQVKASQNSKFGITVNVVDTSLILIADPTLKNSEAIVFKIEQLLASSQNISSASANNVGMFLCRMDQYENDRLRIIDDFSSTISIDNRGSTKDSLLTSIHASVEPLVMRVSLRDIRLAISIFNKAMDLAQKHGYIEEQAAEGDENENGENGHTTFTKEFKKKLAKYAPSIATSIGSVKPRRQSVNEPEILIRAEELSADIEGFRLVLIGDIHELPVLDMSVNPFHVSAKNWSSDLEADTSIESSINIFNYAKSSWEPLLEPWPIATHISRTQTPKSKIYVDFVSRKLAQVTLSSRSIALLSQVMSSISADKNIKGRGAEKPYKILNETGFDIQVWIDTGNERPNLTKIKDGEVIPWEFEDWKNIRENLTTDNKKGVLGVELLDSGYGAITNIHVTSEGEDLFMLEPPVNDYHNRLAVDISLGEDNVKTIKLSSTITIENNTQVNIVIRGRSEFSIPQGSSRSIPIEEVYDTPIYVKPDINVPFEWSENNIYWRRLSRSGASIRCPSVDPTDSTSFFFQVEAKYDRSEPLSRIYPHMKIILSPPLEIENLLPYDLSYRLYDRSAKRDWKNSLRKGNTSPVHVVKLEHFLLLSVKPLECGFEKSDFAIINAPNNSDFKKENRLLLKNEDGQNLKLNIHYSSTRNEGAGIKVVIYSPYIVLNRTGRDLFVREKYNTLQSKVKTNEEMIKNTSPKMFSFEEKRDRGSRALIGLADSGWSKPVSFEAIGRASEVTMQLPNKKSEMNVGIEVKEGEGKYQLSKVVTISPRYIIKNNLSTDIEIVDIGSSDSLHLKSGSMEPLYRLPRMEDKQLKLLLPGGSSKWSSPFSIKDIGQVFLKVYKQDVGQVLLKVDVLLEGSSLFIHIEDGKNRWPFSIRNFSDEEFIFYQKNPNLNENDEVVTNDHTPFKPIYYKIPPKSVMPYAWDYPGGIMKELIIRAEGRERYIQLAEIGNLRPMRLTNSGKIVDLNVVADGPTQSLVISKYEPSNSLYKLRDVRTSSSLSVNQKDNFEPEAEDSDIMNRILFKFEGIGISLINTRQQELCYITVRGVELHFNDSELYQTASCKMKWIQIDNQLYGGIYPIILYPTVVAQSSREMNNHPAFSGAISRVKDDSYGVTYIKYATTLLQEMTLEVDEDFLFALLDFSKVPGASWNKEVHDQLCENVIVLPEPVNGTGGSDIYFEALHIQPTQLNLSFVRTERINAEDKSSSQNPVMFFFNVLTMAIGNINEAPIKLNALFLENIRVPTPVLVQSIQTHYGQAFFYQIHKVLGSADFIGNPVGLFNNISSGVMDIFYEPYQGLVMNDRPQELGISVAKGGLSFLKKSVFGFSDSFAKVTGSISKGLTVATMDKNFQDRRRMSRRRNKPKHALYGFSAGASSFVEGISSGISGIALAPVQGANEGGAGGFIKGIGKGLIGLPTKTAIGVFDLANNVSEGIRNTTTAFDSEGIDKIRLPRYISHDAIIRPFSEREAQGQFWLKMAGGGELVNDDYLAHVVLPGEEMAVIVTYKHIVLVKVTSLEVVWTIIYEDVRSITQEKTGIKIGLSNGKRGPFVPIPEANSRKFLYKHIGIAVNEYNKHCQVIP